MKISHKILLTIAFTGALTSLSSTTNASTSTVNDSDLIAHYQAQGVLAQRLAADAIWPMEYDPTTNMDGAKVGTATITASSGRYFYLDDSSDLFCGAIISSSLRTYKATSLAASWNATTAVTLTETLRNGADPAGSAGSLIITLTKTGSAVDLTRAKVVDFLRALKVASLSTLTGTGLTLTSDSALTTGWAATGIFKDSTPTAEAGVLDHLEFGITLPISIAGVSTSFLASLKTLDTWNVANNSAFTDDVVFTAAGALVKFQSKPAKITKTAGLQAATLAKFVALKDRFLAVQSSPSLHTMYPASLAAGDSIIHARYLAVDGALYAKMALDAAVKAAATDLVVGDFTTTADTNKYGAASLDGAISSVTWATDNEKIIATGTIGSGVPEEFTCDVTGLLIVKDDTNNVLTFTAPSGHSFFVKAFDGTGLDMTAETDYGNAFRDNLLAAALTDKLGTDITTIAAMAVDAIHH